jgi:hypothetical protein
VLDTLLADPGLMTVPAVKYQEVGPRCDDLYGGPPTLDTTSTLGACGADGVGCGSLVGSATTLERDGPGGPGLVEPLGLIICGLPAISGAINTPPLAHRREIASMTQLRAREPVNEILLSPGVSAASPFPSEVGRGNVQGASASAPAPKGQGDSDSSSSSETPPISKPLGAKKQRVKAPARGTYTRGSLKTISEIQESGSIGQAMEMYEGAKVAATSAGSHASRLKWWETMASNHGHPTYPLTVPALKLAGSLLKGGGL